MLSRSKSLCFSIKGGIKEQLLGIKWGLILEFFFFFFFLHEFFESQCDSFSWSGSLLSPWFSGSLILSWWSAVHSHILNLCTLNLWVKGTLFLHILSILELPDSSGKLLRLPLVTCFKIFMKQFCLNLSLCLKSNHSYFPDFESHYTSICFSVQRQKQDPSFLGWLWTFSVSVASFVQVILYFWFAQRHFLNRNSTIHYTYPSILLSYVKQHNH